jgi:serine/threonine protein kinase
MLPVSFTISLKYAIGGDLASEIERYRSQGMTEDHAMHNFTQICLGLVAVHTRGITHKDLKPENIYFDCFGRLKIGGLVRVTTKKTKVPAPLLNYLAPEVHQGLAVS